jgi:hypothetical protein
LLDDLAREAIGIRRKHDEQVGPATSAAGGNADFARTQRDVVDDRLGLGLREPGDTRAEFIAPPGDLVVVADRRDRCRIAACRRLNLIARRRLGLLIFR